jgi:HD-like signal output (HDOD) protein
MHSLAPIEIDPKTFLRQHCSLPQLPTYATRIQEMVRSDNTDIRELTEVISSEPSLVAQILKVVNSSYYGLPREITDLRFAIAFLGLNEVYRMVLSLLVIESLEVPDKDELGRFWFHSFYTALCTKHMASHYERHLSFEDLWSAAILHDIGKLVYLKFFPEHYKAMAGHCREQGCLFEEAERHFSLPSSCYLGTLLCDHWRLPSTVRAACEAHRMTDLLNADASRTSDMFVRMISLGNLSAILAANELAEPVRQEIAEAMRTAMGWTEAEFLTVMGTVFELKTEATTFVGQFA